MPPIFESPAEVEGSQRYHFWATNICDQLSLERGFLKHRLDNVMHLVTESQLDLPIDNPPEVIEAKCVGICKLLEADNSCFMTLEGSRNEAFRCVYLSTRKVNSTLACGGSEARVPDLAPCTEAASCIPSSSYVARKAGTDHRDRVGCLDLHDGALASVSNFPSSSFNHLNFGERF